MIYDPQTHVRKLLNVGTFAIFDASLRPQQIWEVTLTDTNGNIVNGYPKWMSASQALVEQAQALKNGQLLNAVPVSEPLPLLDTGFIDQNAINGNSQILELSFMEYPEISFGSFPWKE
jgi:hypothetical protein